MFYLNEKVTKDTRGLVHGDKSAVASFNRSDILWRGFSQHLVVASALDGYFDFKVVFNQWQAFNINFIQYQFNWLPYFTLQPFLKVKNVPNLTRLGHSPSIPEPFPTIIRNGVISCFTKPTEQQITTYQSARAPLACVAMHEANVVSVLLHELEHHPAQFDEQEKRRAVMVLPLDAACDDLLVEETPIVIFATHVDDQVVHPVLALNVISDVFDVVAV